jgi:hypothetical protein
VVGVHDVGAGRLGIVLWRPLESGHREVGYMMAE